jgi:hypothetical protein
MLGIHQVTVLLLFYMLYTRLNSCFKPLLWWTVKDFTQNKMANAAIHEAFQIFLVKKLTETPQGKLWKLKTQHQQLITV